MSLHHIDGLFRQSLSGSGTGEEWVAIYYVGPGPVPLLLHCISTVPVPT